MAIEVDRVGRNQQQQVFKTNASANCKVWSFTNIWKLMLYKIVNSVSTNNKNVIGHTYILVFPKKGSAPPKQIS